MDLPGYLKYGKFLLICKFRDLAVDCPDIGTCVEDDAGSSALFHSFDELEQIEVFCQTQTGGEDHLPFLDEGNDLPAFNRVDPSDEIIQSVFAGDQLHVQIADLLIKSAQYYRHFSPLFLECDSLSMIRSCT